LTVSINLNTVTFSPQTNIAVGYQPFSVKVGDFNSDGNMDIVTVHNSGDVSLLLGDGLGDFTNQITFPADRAYSVIVGDFNVDGKVDLGVAVEMGAVQILLGDGQGKFNTPTTFAANYPHDFVMGDFNGDGNVDLAAADLNDGYNDNTLSVLLGDGQGGFGKSTVFLVGGNGPITVSMGDFNKDGKADLVSANSNSNNVSVLLGNGRGGFANPLIFSVGKMPNRVLVTDVNKDGNEDLITTNIDNNNVSILLGNGSGDFGPQTTFIADYPLDAVLADFNGDGNIDIAATGAYGNTNHWVSLLLGDGQGLFSHPTKFSVGVGPWSISTGDFNNDGKTDVVTGNLNSNNVSILITLL
jgi:FG-GAP-like repeat